MFGYRLVKICGNNMDWTNAMIYNFSLGHFFSTGMRKAVYVGMLHVGKPIHIMHASPKPTIAYKLSNRKYIN